MMNQSPQHLELIEYINSQFEPHLKEGHTYHQDFFITKLGSVDCGIYLRHEGEIYTPRYAKNNPEDPLIEGLEALDETIREMKMNRVQQWSLFSGQPADTKVRFTYRKGQPMEMLVLDAEHLIEDMKTEIRYDALRYRTEKSEVLKTEAILSLVQQAGELGIYTDATTVFSTGAKSYSSTVDSKLIKCLMKAIGGDIQKLYYKLEGETFVIQSGPGYPEYGIPELEKENESIQLEESYKKRRDAQDEAIRIREAFYHTLGRVDERKIYLNVDGYNNYNWPEGSNNHISEVLRVIYADDSTIVITDGLSDVFSSEESDPGMDCNGIGGEMYIEFDGHVAFETIKEHFCVALLNTTTQIFLETGYFKALIEQHKHLAIELRQEDIELWSVKDLYWSNNDISTFFRRGQYAPDNFGVLINMPSKNVPAKLKMNLEEIVVVNVKPFTNEWVTPKLRDKDTQEQVRMEMMAKFEALGEGNKIPLTYIIEGADDTLADIFPLSDVEPRDTEINMELIYSMASRKELSKEEVEKMVMEHHAFIAAGGENGRFEQLHTGGLPLNVYVTQVKEGTQFKTGRRTIAGDVSFSEVSLPSSEFTGCIAKGIDFSHADLTYSLFTNAFLQGANFEEADLRGVDFTGSDVSGANFRNAQLDNADFEIANCTGADFTGANTTDATFRGANMADVKY